MEYIKRRKKRAQRKKSGGAGRVVVALLFCAAAVYLISASAAGTWLAETVIAPVFTGIEEVLSGKIRQEEQGESQSVSLSGDTTKQEEITLPALTCHMLQMGVYSNHENAVSQAQALQARGAGGYIIEEDSRYRVIASGYDTEESLDSVRQQLLAEGIESAKYKVELPKMVFHVTANEAQLTAVRDGFAALKQAQGELSLLAIEFDRNGMSVVQGREAAKEILAPIEEKRAVLSVQQGEGTVLAKVMVCYDAATSAINALAEFESESNVDFSSKIKYTHLQVTHEYAKLIESLSSTS